MLPCMVSSDATTGSFCWVPCCCVSTFLTKFLTWVHVRIITAGTPGLWIMIAGADHVQLWGSWFRLLNQMTQECYACVAVHAGCDVFELTKCCNHSIMLLTVSVWPWCIPAIRFSSITSVLCCVDCVIRTRYQNCQHCLCQSAWQGDCLYHVFSCDWLW